MTDLGADHTPGPNTPAARRRRRVWPVSVWSLGAALIAALALAPIVAVIWIALDPADNIWPHLARTTLPRYMENTLVMMLGVGALTGLAGTGSAWLVSMYRFALSRFFSWALLLPLGIPAYVGAYALVDFLEYAGPVQTGLRHVFGWGSAQDYHFPEIRSRFMAILVLSGALYPYVFLLARTAFREQSGAVFEVARALGSGHWARFWRVGLPLARPAIAAGIAVVMMETVNDFGVVDYFAVQTLTTGIFSVWLESYNAGGAAQIALVVLAMVLVLLALEKVSRRKLRYFQTARRHQTITLQPVTGPLGWIMAAACAVPFSFGFVLPIGVIGWHAIQNADAWADPALISALLTTVSVGGAAAVMTVTAALFMTYAVRLSGRNLPRLLLPITTIGYAAPGAVLAVGVLIPLAALDHRLADGVLALTGMDPGLILTGTGVAIVLAYCVRFFAIAVGTADAAMGRVSPSLPMAARALGRSQSGVLRAVYLPLMRGSVATALLLVFVDCVKELPATLLLRPFNFNTLSTRVYEQASLEQLGRAAPAAVLVTAVGLLAVVFLIRAARHD